MYNNYENKARSYAGVPYDDINWYDVVGQPFGIASYFNAIVFGDANNIVDTKGAMAVGGNFVSSRGLSLAYGDDGKLLGTGYSPDFVRFLVGRNVAMQGPLVVIGHVVAGGNFRAASGSTYMIEKDGTAEQVKELTDLYQANGGSKYWRLSDRDTHYAVSSYDVPRYIPAARIGADVEQFFANAKESISYYHECITGLQPNGTVTEHFHELILRGNDPVQNVFLIDVSPNGILNKEIRFEIPEGSLAIVKFKTGNNAHLQYGLWGDKRNANHTLYVFEDAKNIFMEVPAAIWGSILAPQAMYHAHQTGGNVNGNAALGAFAVAATSGFEFHLYPFVGGVVCMKMEPMPPEVPEEIPPRPLPTPQPAPQMPLPTPPRPMPAPQPMPPRPMPAPQPMPPRPMPTPQPIPPRPMPTPQPIPPRPMPAPQPIPPRPMPAPQPIPLRPIPAPRPIPSTPAPCPTCPTQQPCPMPIPSPEAIICPPCRECPPPIIPILCPTCPIPAPCPVCPEPITLIEFQPFPIPIPVACPEQECCQECLIIPGTIFGCIWGCSCCCDHEWEVKLYKICNEKKVLLHCIKMCSCGCFQFHVPYDGCYLLVICPVGQGKNSKTCRPMLTLKNVGVTNLMFE